MKAPPPGLPPANSRKWASRRWWDQLGYLRVRSLANPNWPRDRELPWLISWLRRESDSAQPADRPLYDQAIKAARHYLSRAKHGISDDDAWDAVLTPIDELLAHRQARHIRAVREAQAEQTSGTVRHRDEAGPDHKE